VIRPARPDDVPAIVTLIRELATYEREPDAAKATNADLHAALFGESPALFGLIAQDPAEGDAGQPVGFALWFLNFSTWEGKHGIYLEDLYVRPESRRAGYGRLLLAELARIASDRGYRRLEWSVLDWNEPGHRFYESLGATAMSEWTTWRLAGDPLATLAAQADQAGKARPDADADARA
jgi:GNAT superfamily N-acetyltransferase